MVEVVRFARKRSERLCVSEKIDAGHQVVFDKVGGIDSSKAAQKASNFCQKQWCA